MTKYATLAILSAATPLFAQSDSKERLTAFLQSPPPIREMVVECNWYAHAIGRTNTNWMVLCWQTNAYILRKATQRVDLFDAFDTNRDELITIRAGDMYYAVGYYKVLGVHAEQVQGLASSGERDLVTPKIRGQEVWAEPALVVGIPIPVGEMAIANGGFTYRDEIGRITLSGVVEVDRSNLVKGFSMTNTVDRTANREAMIVPMSITYEYGGTSQPLWFPHQIVREAVIDGKRLTICRLVVHRLDLGVMPLAEFYPDRFLSGSPPGKIVTSNGLSYVTLKGVTKPVMDPKDPQARGIHPNTRAYRAVYALLVVAFAVGALALLGLARRRQAEK
jgi:hypothetical protein